MTTVAGQRVDDNRKARRRRGGAAIGASLLAHMVVFAIIGLNAARLVDRQPPPTRTAEVWLMPRLTLQQHEPAEPVATILKAAPLAAARPAPPKPAKAPPPRPTPTPLQAAAPAPVRGQGAPGGVKSGPAPADQGQGADVGDGVREALRTSVGCDADPVVHLTPAEQARCNQKVGEMAKRAPAFSGIDSLKRGRFDDQAAADERRRANRTGPIHDGFVPCKGEGSNLGGGCLPDDAIMHVHQH